MNDINRKIQEYAYGKNVKLWQIAAKIGMPDTSLSKKMRFPLSRGLEKQVYKAIDEIAEEKGA